MCIQHLLDAGCSLRILGNHIKIAATTCTGQLITETEVINEIRQRSDSWRIRSAVELLVLLPRTTHEQAHPHEIVLLDSFIHLHRVFLHLTQQSQFVAMIQEHPTDNLCQNLFSCARDARVIQQMTGTVFGLEPQIVGQPSYLRTLIESPTRLQEFHATQDATELVLPSATGCQHLFEHQRAMSYLILVPA